MAEEVLFRTSMPAHAVDFGVQSDMGAQGDDRDPNWAYVCICRSCTWADYAGPRRFCAVLCAFTPAIGHTYPRPAAVEPSADWQQSIGYQ